MMDIQLRDYQLDCLDKVMSKINDGARHLSVVMTVGLGQKTTSLFLAKKLDSREHAKTAMVFRYKDALMQTKADAEKLGIESAEFFSVKEFLDNDKEYRYIVLHDLSTYDRKQIQECVQNKRSITISFSTSGQELAGDNVNPAMNQRLMAYMEKLSPVVCVYVTNEVLDIRDVKYAGETESVYVNKENLATANWLQQERIQAVNERDEVKKRNERLQAYMKAIKQVQDQQKIKEQAAEIERLKALLQEDEQNKKIEELEAREIEYQEQLKEKDARIAQQDQMIAFQQDILSGFGIDAAIIQDSFNQIQMARVSLKNDLESSDDAVKEIALKQLQDKVAEIVSTLTHSALSTKDHKYFEDYLIGELTEEVWGRLDEKSKAFLITAKSNYETMIKMKDSETFDYSGVCLLVTKALEVETTKRFFLSYKNFLKQKYSSVSRWPFALRQWDRGQITETVIADSEFTLGSVVSVIGLKRVYDTDGNITGYQIANVGTKNEFLDYARNNLFKFSEQRRVEAEIDKDYHFIEKVRLDYRNPSAHRDRLTITSARGCLEYVIDVQHMLKEMLSTMKI